MDSHIGLGLRRLAMLGLIALGLAASFAVQGEPDRYDKARRALVEEVAAEARLIELETGRPGLQPRVLQALRTVPRHLFVDEDLRDEAYENRPLPIGHGQTISQPFIVAIMTDLVDVEEGHRVLEVGTGSGYQAAVLAALGAQVYSIEIIEALAESARTRLVQLEYRDIHLRQDDGYYGWPEHGPFDAIVVTAAASHVPPPLIRQLKPGGRMIIPVGSAFSVQQLVLLTKDSSGEITMRQLLPVRFVPLTGEH
ncbi:MAG: protein-L-isoaspartate O-methyltransferase [Gammaproteobacteria bacterium SG8_47]|nr:MAG: protein-L-isoaspartate O-methyltransferase [Gammaproteobacteria bacterium SG8_47]